MANPHPSSNGINNADLPRHCPSPDVRSATGVGGAPDGTTTTRRRKLQSRLLTLALALLSVTTFVSKVSSRSSSSSSNNNWLLSKAVLSSGGVSLRHGGKVLSDGGETTPASSSSWSNNLDYEDDYRLVRKLQQSVDGESNNNNNNTLCTLDCCRTYETEICSAPSAEEGGGSWTDALPTGVQIFFVVILLLLSSLFSGLTLGFMALDPTGLEIAMAGDDPRLASYAKNIYPIRKRGNWLLCTLTLGNVAVNSLLSIFLAEFTGGTVGFITSTMLIVIFGEILPQAVVSRHALRIGSASVGLVKVVRILLCPVAFPISLALDWILGHEVVTTYSTSEMMHLLKIQLQENAIDQEAANTMQGALMYKNMTVKEVMTPMDRTFMLDVDDKLSFETIGKIFKTGYSRIPIYEISRNNVIGILFAKDLIFIDPEDEVPIRSFIHIFGRSVHVVWPDDTLGDVLAELKKGRSHMALVRDVNKDDETTDPFYEVKGIITLEDIVERILGDSIVDETDTFVDNMQTRKVDRGDSRFEWARLRLLDSKIVDEKLSTSEISAVVAHLRTNFADSFTLLTDSQLTRLISSTPVVTFSKATQDVGQALPNELLYEKGVPSDFFTLILSGKVTIFVGEEGFRSDLSAWSVLGKTSLDRTSWTPDFTAYVSDGPCRCIRIHHAAFVEAMDASVMERRMIENKVASASVATRVSSGGVEATSIEGSARRSVASSTEEDHVPNRRGNILKFLFPDSEKNIQGGDDTVVVQDADADIVAKTDGTSDTKGHA